MGTQVSLVLKRTLGPEAAAPPPSPEAQPTVDPSDHPAPPDSTPEADADAAADSEPAAPDAVPAAAEEQAGAAAEEEAGVVTEEQAAETTVAAEASEAAEAPETTEPAPTAEPTGDNTPEAGIPGVLLVGLALCFWVFFSTVCSQPPSLVWSVSIKVGGNWQNVLGLSILGSLFFCFKVFCIFQPV